MLNDVPFRERRRLEEIFSTGANDLDWLFDGFM